MRTTALVTGIIGGVFGGISAVLLLVAAVFAFLARRQPRGQLMALRARRDELDRLIAELEGRPISDVAWRR